jgi:hypothetical protein
MLGVALYAKMAAIELRRVYRMVSVTVHLRQPNTAPIHGQVHTLLAEIFA